MKSCDDKVYSCTYILDLSEKDNSSVIYDLGTKYDRIEECIPDRAKLISEKFPVEEKEIPYSTYLFLVDIGFVDDVDHYLTDEGKKYFEEAFILQEEENAQALIKEKLRNNPVINLIGQVFYGRGKISKEQLCNLLNYHNVTNWNITVKELNSLLVFLNKYSILTYDKKNNVFYLKEPIQPDQPIKQYFVNPTTPFSNIYNMRKVLRACRGDVYWIDKHFRKEGLEIILDGMASEGVRSYTIISGKENVTQSAKADYEMLKVELVNRSIVLNWRILDDSSFKWHDRWIVADDLCYNIPPVLSIIRGQRADIIQIDSEFDITPFMENSLNI